MRKLNRNQAPVCLSRYKHGTHNWADLTSQDRAEIWTALKEMQGDNCAYCEAGIDEKDRHIEHFRQKGRDARVTFQWDNLFGSCNRYESCGRHKDRCGVYDPAVLIKPDTDEPDDYWVFVTDGTIRARSGLDAQQLVRAEESLRIFNIDAERGKLRSKRREAVRGYLETAEVLAELFEEAGPQAWQQLVDEELSATQGQPFATAIRHVLTGAWRRV